MKLSGLHYFVLGVIITLIILDLYPPTSLPKSQISFMVQGSLPEWLTAIGTLLAVFSALGIAIYGRSLGEWRYKSDLRIVKPLENIQPESNHTTGQTRLLIKNEGNAISEDVEVYVNKLLDNGHERRNFLPVPLYWTHWGSSKRNFHPNQFGYLDLCRRAEINDPNEIPKLVLQAGAGVSTYENIRSGKTELELIFFQKSGEIRKYKILLEWRRGQPYAHVAKHTEIS